MCRAGADDDDVPVTVSGGAVVADLLAVRHRMHVEHVGAEVHRRLVAVPQRRADAQLQDALGVSPLQGSERGGG